MDASRKTFFELVGIIKSWFTWRSDPANVSRDFWMPDESCRVCYECDAQFTIINRRHHCRLCGRIFCGKCTSNSVPVPSNGDGTCWEEREKIRACNYCFTQWQQAMTTHENGEKIPNLGLSSSLSGMSLGSTKSSSTVNKGPHSIPPSSASCQHAQESPVCSSLQSSGIEMDANQQIIVVSEKNNGLGSELRIPSAQYRHFMDRLSPSPISDDEDDGDEYELYRGVSNTRSFPELDYYGQIDNDKMVNHGGFREVHLHEGNIETRNLSNSAIGHSFGSGETEGPSQLINRKEDESIVGDECETSSSIYAVEDVNAEPLDFENNGLLWLPPEPEDEEDERESLLLDDDDGEADPTGDWGYLRSSSSFGSGDFRNRNRTNEEHKNAVKNIVDEHFKALVSQLLQVENLSVSEENSEGSWLDIITSLSWEAATLLKPDTSKSGGMDPGGYVKVKCLASGRRSDSMVIKGVVCKKNVAHRRMISKIEKPRLLILRGALEYQRVSNHLSSFDTLLQQEMDHLKMAVAKIHAHRPDILLVEKSVSRFAQEYLLAKEISLVLNIKRPLLEHLARCTGAQILPSIDNISPQKLGYCEKFHVDRFLEDHGTAGQGGKKLVKTLMYFEGCPKPLGFTILLRGANGDELKKVKHVIQYGVFAAYHLALETSFLADEGASLPEFPLNASVAAAFPDKSSTIERSISTIPGFAMPSGEKTQGPEPGNEPQRSHSVPIQNLSSLKISSSKPEIATPPFLSNCLSSKSPKLLSRFTNPTSSFHCPSSRKILSEFPVKSLSSYDKSETKRKTGSKKFDEHLHACKDGARLVDHPVCNGFPESHPLGQATSPPNGSVGLVPEEIGSLEGSRPTANEQGPLKEEFPPSPSDHQSILVSLSSRCVWKGTVCERSHLFRIKYYGTFDKPLGRFLRDDLFDQNYRCGSCDMPSEAHVHCYTHRQGTLTISVKKLAEFLLPGERDGKIWMWHRCLRCPRKNGFPPATQRIVMSDAAWGLSFGKFLELSFSNHAAASRVARCGHSLHRDCLRFYGFGSMVACFRYASIDVYSVYLPPSKLDFNSENQEWMEREANEVSQQAGFLFSEVLKALHQIAEKKCGVTLVSSEAVIPDLRNQFVELEGTLQKEKTEFEESLKKAMNRENEDGQTLIDILEVNRLRRQLLFQSYMWDNRLIYAASLNKNKHKHSGLRSPISEKDDNSIVTNEITSEINVSKLEEVLNSTGSLSVKTKVVEMPKQEGDCENQFDNSVSVGNKVDVGRAASLDQRTSVYNDVEPLESDTNVRRTLSEGQYPAMTNLSATLDAAWTGKREDNSPDSAAANSSIEVVIEEGIDINGHEDRNELKISLPVSLFLPARSLDSGEESVSWLKVPFLSFYRSLNKSFLGSSQKLDSLGVYDPVYVPSFRDLEMRSGARLLLPIGVNDTIIPVYDDEPTSIISYALLSPDYHSQLSDLPEKIRDTTSASSSSFSDSLYFPSPQSTDEMVLESSKSFGSLDESMSSMSGSRGPQVLDPLYYTKASHARVSFADDSGKVKYSVTCYFAKRFEALRRICCPSELDFIRSLSRCKKWGAQGGKSNVFFAKTLDDRFIIKQVTKTELESFIKFGPGYFKYLLESISTRSPTCLAKILGIYQVTVTSKHVKGGKELKMDVLVMENLLFGRNVTKLYDLKGSSRSRYNPDSSGCNKVLLDQNLIEAMPTSPIFVGNKAKRLLERAVWNDTSFLSSIDVMDYSLLVGVDEDKHELVLGIIDFMRQYTWDKHLETWVKASGILGGPKNASPTVISPKQYKKRFRKAMTTYFLMVPDQWSPPTTIPSRSDSTSCEEYTQNRPSIG